MRYKEFLQINEHLNEAKDVHTHSDHLEDMVLLYKSKGLSKAIASILHILKEFRKYKSSNLSLKFDGAPALIFGYLNNKFFIATKSLFNKTPKINFNDNDIDNNHPGELGDTLKVAFKYLPEIIIDKDVIYQCDVMFTDKTKKLETIKEEKLISFQTNTIKYAVNIDSSLGQSINDAKLGVAIHTLYTSNGIDTSSIKLKSFKVYENMFKSSKNVWFTDPYHRDATKTIEMSEYDMKSIQKSISDIMSSVIKWDSIDSDVYTHMLTYINSYYKTGIVSVNIYEKVNNFIKWIENKKETDVNTLKTEKAKLKKSLYWNSIVDNIDDNINDIHLLFKIHEDISNIKLIVLNKIDDIKRLKTFVETVDGDILVTKDEGYIISNFPYGNGIKLIDRLCFSTNNFSDFIKKGWQKK